MRWSSKGQKHEERHQARTTAAINAVEDDSGSENETIKELKKLKEEVMAVREEAK